jgi:hypothetical protein
MLPWAATELRQRQKQIEKDLAGRWWCLGHEELLRWQE